MDINKYFKSIIDQDRCAVVICNTEHIIIYMNSAAKRRYARRGGGNLVGKSLLECHNEESCKMIKSVLSWFCSDVNNNIAYTSHNKKDNKDVYIIALRDEDGTVIGYYEKHEYRNRETGEMYKI